MLLTISAIQSSMNKRNISETINYMENLPLEVALDILSRLPITYLIRVKWVCRSWRTLAQHPLLPLLHFSRMAEANRFLLLPIQNHLYSLNFSSSDHNALNIQTLTRILVPNLIPQFIIAGSCNGLLCLSDSLSQHQYFIYNPFTIDFLQLPNPKRFLTQHRVASGFGFHSSRNEYKVVRIVYYRVNKVEDADVKTRKPLPESNVEILTVRDGALTWRNVRNTLYQVQGRPSNVMVGGKLHWLSCQYRKNWVRNIISFDLADEQFQQVPSPQMGMFVRYCTDLVSLRGCLSAVVKGYKCLYIWVMKEYGVKESWIKEFTISRDPQLNPYADEFINGSQCFPLNLSQVRVLCILQNGEILLQQRCRYLVVFNPISGVLREVVVPGLLQQDFDAVVHIGSLNWPDIKSH